MLSIKTLYQPTTIEEALLVLADHEEATIISGGTDVLVKMHNGALKDAELISIHDIPELKGVRRVEGDIIIGSATSFARMADGLKETIRYLADAVLTVGGPQTRNMGTVGGNICNGAVSADSLPMLLALNAQLRLRKKDGERLIPLLGFHVGPGRVALEKGELLCEIIIRKADYQGFGGHYIKFSPRNAMDISTLGTACAMKLGEGGKIDDFRLAYGVAGPTPIRCLKAEELVKGRVFSENLVEEMAGIALTETQPRDSWRASKAFREQLIQETARRAFVQAYIGAGGAV